MKKTEQELVDSLNTAARDNKLHKGTLWRHYRGDVYEVEGLSIDCNTNEVLVLYHRKFEPFDLNGEGHFSMMGQITFTRPLREWLEVIDGVQRFVKVGPYTCYMTANEYSMFLYKQR